MRKVVLLSLLSTVFAFNAHATKARVNSLLGAKHLVDSQSIFSFPSHINSMGQYMTLEFGPAGTGTTEPKAEGGIFKKEDGAVMGAYLGHHDMYQASLRTVSAYPMQTNPVQFFYGKENWGATVGLSNTDRKTTKEKETTLYAGYGMSSGDLTWGVNAELIANAEKDNAGTTEKYTGAPMLNAKFTKGTNQYFHGEVLYGDTKVAAAAGDTKTKDMGLELGWVDRNLSNDKRDLYYGISLAYGDRDIGGSHIKSMSLPVVLGLEHQMNSWATFRGSLKQNLLLGSVKDDTATAPANETDTVPNNTTVSAGLGLKYDSLTLDGVLSAATSGNINGNAILAQAGLIYSF